MSVTANVQGALGSPRTQAVRKIIVVAGAFFFMIPGSFLSPLGSFGVFCNLYDVIKCTNL